MWREDVTLSMDVRMLERCLGHADIPACPQPGFPWVLAVVFGPHFRIQPGCLHWLLPQGLCAPSVPFNLDPLTCCVLSAPSCRKLLVKVTNLSCVGLSQVRAAKLWRD